jgi:hypothetical protein
MIRRLNQKDAVSVLDFVNTYNDFFQEMFITISKERVFLKGNLKLIEKLLKYQEIHAIEKSGIEGIVLIYREKGYRPYIKILCKSQYNKDIIKYLKWNIKSEVFIKIKVKNSLLKELVDTVIIDKLPKYFPKIGFSIIGLRGTEILIKKNREINKEIKHGTY